MTNALRGALILAAGVACGAAAPDLGCSADGTRGAILQIAANTIFHDDTPAEAAEVSLAGDLTAVRTVSATDVKHVCEAVLSIQVAPAAAPTPPAVPDESAAAFDKLFDTIMKESNYPAALQDAARQSDFYKHPKSGWAEGRSAYSVDAVSGDGTREYTIQLIASSKTYQALKAADEAYWAAQRAASRVASLVSAASYQARSFNGEISYSVEATDDGQAYITLLPAQN